MGGPAGVLDERRPSGRKITFGAIAEPPGAMRDVGVLGDAELGLRALDEFSILFRRARDAHRGDRSPAVLLQQLLRSVDRQLEALRRARRKFDEPYELLVLVSSDVGEALDLPRHHRREAIPRRHSWPSVCHRESLPRLLPLA